MVGNSNMMKKISYTALLDTARGAFDNALHSLDLSADQAFAYAYDHIEVLLRDPMTWTKVAAYTALFKCAKEYAITLRPNEDQFDEDVLQELRSAMAEYGRIGVKENVPDEMRELPEDIEIVRQEYL